MLVSYATLVMHHHVFIMFNDMLFSQVWSEALSSGSEAVCVVQCIVERSGVVVLFGRLVVVSLHQPNMLVDGMTRQHDASLHDTTLSMSSRVRCNEGRLVTCRCVGFTLVP